MSDRVGDSTEVFIPGRFSLFGLFLSKAGFYARKISVWESVLYDVVCSVCEKRGVCELDARLISGPIFMGIEEVNETSLAKRKIGNSSGRSFSPCSRVWQ